MSFTATTNIGTNATSNVKLDGTQSLDNKDVKTVPSITLNIIHKWYEDKRCDTINMLYDDYSKIYHLHLELKTKYGIYEDMPRRFIYVLQRYSTNKISVKINDNGSEEYGITDEWYHYDVPDGNNPSASSQNNCVCSHWIEQQYYIRSRLNGNILLVGSDCILKVADDKLKEIINKILKARAYNKKNGNDAKNKQCATCHNHRVPIDSEPWKKDCKSCYRDKVASKKKRICKTCLIKTISQDAPTWKVQCYNCYLSQKK